MTLLVVLIVLSLLGLAAAFGRTADSRDPDYSVGALLADRGRRHPRH